VSLDDFTNLDRPTRRRYAITVGVALVACILAYLLWWHYLRSPWTRDGRVRVEVVAVASQVAGQVRSLSVADNQWVKKGDVLFEIDPVDYRLALQQAESTLKSRESDLQVAQENSVRRQKLGQAVSIEDRQTSQSSADVASAARDSAQAARDQAQVNLERTVIRSPVNGYVTNLTLRVGDYATPGQTKLTMVDSDSFWIVGYFEETKLPHIHPGDEARVRLMGWGPEIRGHVESTARAIADTNADDNAVGLANVSPIFTWVRLAQRIPVRIKIDEVPRGVTISAGQTCTIVIRPGSHARDGANAAN
jgi:multidrug resistance efflux pump